MEVNVALDGPKQRDLIFYAGDDLSIVLKVYAHDGDLDPIVVENVRFDAPAGTVPVGTPFTVPYNYIGRSSYRIVGDVSGITTTLVYGVLETPGGWPSAWCWGYEYGNYPYPPYGVVGKAENITVRDDGNFFEHPANVEEALQYLAGTFGGDAAALAAASAIEAKGYRDASGQYAANSAASASQSATFRDAAQGYSISAADSAATSTVQAGLSGSKAAESAASAITAGVARDTALALQNFFPDTTAALSNGVLSVGSLVPGTGGTNGTFDLAFTGGAGTGAAGKFVVTGGSISQIVLTAKGSGYTSAPTVSFAASSGLTGASAVAVIGTNAPASSRFSTPSPAVGETAIIYENVAGVATERSRVANSDAVQKPVWAGKRNGWPDQFFKRSTPGVDFLGRKRWTDNGVAPVFPLSLVPNAIYPVGKALRRSVQFTAGGNLSGPTIYLDEIGAAPGDKITIAALIIGTGGTVLFPVRSQNASLVAVGAQFNGVTDAGASSMTTSAVPQRMSATFDVPTGIGATAVWCYPYTTTAGQSYDIVTLLAWKGDLAAGPTWATYSEESVLEDIVNGQKTDIAGLGAPVAYGFSNYGQVTASATAVTLDGTGFSAAARDLPFRGWGETFTPAGVSFNAIRCKSIGRTAVLTSSRWRTMRALVRTGAASSGASAPIVAVGSITVRDDLDTLTDLTILLKDPTTGAVKTLTDADFSGGQYFIAVWAENAAGAPASCGEPRGTMANSLGQSYYITNVGGTPNTAAWTATTSGSNQRLAFQHLLLTSPVEVAVQIPSQALINDIGASSPMPVPELVMPPYIFGVQGRECNVYLDNLHLDDAASWLHDLTTASSTGQQQVERWTWTPAAALASGSVSVSVHDKRTGTLLATKTALQRAAATAAGSGLNKKVMVIGDSLVNAGTITQTLLDIAAADVMGVTLLGTRGTGANKHEGRGGYMVSDYTTAGRTYRGFTVSGVTVVPAINAAKYTDGATVWTVQEVNISGGAGTVSCSVDSGPNTPPASGTLTKTNGSAGDASLSYSANAPVSGNPFWISGALNFGQYLINNSIAAPDWAVIALGINDVFGQTSDAAASSLADSAFTALDALIASIKAADAGTKVALMLPSPPSASQDAFGANYATGQTRWRDKRNILVWTRQLIAKYAGQEAARIYIVPSNTALDTTNNMERAAAAPVNSRSAVTVARQSNGVHPATSGYQQIGDALWAFLKYYA